MDKQFKRRLLRSLLSDTIPPDEIMKAYDIYHYEVPLHASVAAFVYRSRKGRYHIFVSSHLSPKARRKVFLHELYHVVEDMPKIGYIVGIDMYRKPIEKNADMYLIMRIIASAGRLLATVVSAPELLFRITGRIWRYQVVLFCIVGNLASVSPP